MSIFIAKPLSLYVSIILSTTRILEINNNNNNNINFNDDDANRMMHASY